MPGCRNRWVRLIMAWGVQGGNGTNMRILITNDDGINAPGLAALTDIARDVAGPDGEVWTVAPAFEQSGVGHCISYTQPTMIAKFDDRRFAAEGSPADCVLAALYDVMRDAPPDLVLSMAKLIAGARYEVIKDAGHIPCVEQPEMLTDMIRAFIDTLSAGDTPHG